MLHRSIAPIAALLGVATSWGCGSQADPSATQVQSLEGSACPASWYDAPPPNPSWPTLSSILPVHYNDVATFISTWFPAAADDLQTLVPATVHPLQVAPGVGLVGLAFTNYRDISGLHPYRESLVMVMVDDSSLQEGYPLALYLNTLFVTTKQAQWVGVQGWGMNKLIGNAVCRNSPPNGVTCTTVADGQLVMKVVLRTEGLSPLPASALNAAVLNSKDGWLVRSPSIYTSSRPDATVIGTYAPGSATVEFGGHPVGQMLANLRIGRTSSMAVWGEHVSTTLAAGVCSSL